MDVESAASSFLDELLGRLAAHLGAIEFAARIMVRGMSPEIQNMANAVIHQRLEHIGNE